MNYLPVPVRLFGLDSQLTVETTFTPQSRLPRDHLVTLLDLISFPSNIIPFGFICALKSISKWDSACPNFLLAATSFRRLWCFWTLIVLDRCLGWKHYFFPKKQRLSQTSPLLGSKRVSWKWQELVNLTRLALLSSPSPLRCRCLASKSIPFHVPFCFPRLLASSRSCLWCTRPLGKIRIRVNSACACHNFPVNLVCLLLTLLGRRSFRQSFRWTLDFAY